MIIERLVIKEYDWAITILLDCEYLYTHEIIDHLQSIECPISIQRDFLKRIQFDQSNINLTYSNIELKRTIIIIGHINNNAKLIDNIAQECYHFIQQLAQANNIVEEETLALLTGRLHMCLYDTVLHIINNSN